jgi:hypothetical protein
MNKKFSNSYIANVSDSTKEKVVYDSVNALGEKIENSYFQRKYSNHRKMLFCSCGNNFQIHQKFIDKQPKIGLFETIKCENCKQEYSDYTNITELSSSFNDNVINIRYRTFERENKIKLVKFMTFANVNNKTKKIFFKKVTNSIVYNKNTNRFYKINTINNKKAVTSIGIKNSFYRFEDIINLHDNNKLKCGISFNEKVIKEEINDFINPLNSFLFKILEQIDERDYDRIFKHIEKGILSIKGEQEIREKHINFINEINYSYTKCLSIVSSIVILPKLANVLFLKGNDFFLDLITLDCFPIPSEIKKENLKSPKNIIDIILKKTSINNNKYHLKDSRILFNVWDDDKVEKEQKNELEQKERNNHFRIKNKKIKTFNLKNNLYNSLKNKNDLSTITFLINSNVEYDDFYYLIDLYGPEKSLIIFNELTNSSFIQNNNYDFEILKHIFKIYIKEIRKKDFYDSKKHRFYNYFDSYFYFDTISMCKQLNLDISEILNKKNWNDIIELHDSYTSLVNLMKMEKFQQGIKDFSKYYENIKSIKINNIEYKLIDDITSLERESSEMHHCVKSYANGLSLGKHLIFSIKNLKTQERATLEFNNLFFKNFQLKDNTSSKYIYENSIWSFSQLKGKYNQKVTKEMIETSYEFFEKLKQEKIKIEIKGDFYDLRINDNMEIPLDELPF